MATSIETENSKVEEILNIDEMNLVEMNALLSRVGFGHLGCSRSGRPYVLPVNFVFAEPFVYIYTTEGMKTEFMGANSEVCLQAEEIQDDRHWSSVVVTGKAERMQREEDKEYVMSLITQKNPTFTPAISNTWTDVWGRGIVEAVYRIEPQLMSGRKTIASRL